MLTCCWLCPLQDLLSGQFNVTLGDKLSEHLKKWIDVTNILQPPQPVSWPAARDATATWQCAAPPPPFVWVLVATVGAGCLGTRHRVGGGSGHARHLPQASAASQKVPGNTG